jgi:hypothetical protein
MLISSPKLQNQTFYTSELTKPCKLPPGQNHPGFATTWQLLFYVTTENYRIAPYPLYWSLLLFPATTRHHASAVAGLSGSAVPTTPSCGGGLGLLLRDGGAVPAAPPRGIVPSLLLRLHASAPSRGRGRLPRQDSDPPSPAAVGGRCPCSSSSTLLVVLWWQSVNRKLGAGAEKGEREGDEGESAVARGESTAAQVDAGEELAAARVDVAEECAVLREAAVAAQSTASALRWPHNPRNWRCGPRSRRSASPLLPPPVTPWPRCSAYSARRARSRWSSASSAASPMRRWRLTLPRLASSVRSLPRGGANTFRQRRRPRTPP